MEYIYHEIDSGRSVAELAKEMGISRMSLYRYHKKYQSMTGEKRPSLTGGRGRRKQVDLEMVYKKLEEGQTVLSIAEEMGICTKTIYRHANKTNGKSDLR